MTSDRTAAAASAKAGRTLERGIARLAQVARGAQLAQLARGARVPHVARGTRLALMSLAIAAGSTLVPLGHAHAEPSAAAQKSAVIDARTAHAKASAGELVLVDIRTPEEWRETGVPASAWAVPLEQKPQSLVASLTKLVDGDKTKPIALICATGGRSSYLAGQLRRVGFVNVVDVSEGVIGNRLGRGWIKAGLPVRPGTEAANPPQLAAPSPPTGDRK